MFAMFSTRNRPIRTKLPRTGRRVGVWEGMAALSLTFNCFSFPPSALLPPFVVAQYSLSFLLRFLTQHEAEGACICVFCRSII